MASDSDSAMNDSDVISQASGSDDSSPSTGMVVFLSGDLIFASRVRAAATGAGLEFKLAGNLPEQSEHPVRFIVVDLSTRSKVVDGLMADVNQRFPDAQVIAYAPHVQVQRIRDARQHGIPTVLTRGQFNEGLTAMFEQ
ncbi:hypothetical protein [Rhodopirellula sp. SWK7]|uniref:hypothetical protein n=1 Tax=Rhodopirellula sp. SWK7 TaxID=595460 RepID=UPI0002BF9CC2|nr:hypothetical protein [Rhodopirellula sp. SWK7]EMI42456.1 hypothetical protein RRSWK_05068 [Rhodopirellula sp. SWK7]